MRRSSLSSRSLSATFEARGVDVYLTITASSEPHNDPCSGSVGQKTASILSFGDEVRWRPRELRHRDQAHHR